MHPAVASRAGRSVALRILAAVLAAFTAGAAPRAHAAGLPIMDGAWQSPLYTGYFSDLLATRTEVWGATREGGLVHLDRITGALERATREPGGLASNELTSVAVDRSGRVWVGTVANGVSRLRADRSGWDVVNRIDGLPVDSVLTLVAVGDTVWIGTTQGLALWNGREVAGSLPDPNIASFDTTFLRKAITGIVQMGDTLWLATRGGVGFARLSAGLTDWRPVDGGITNGLLDIEDLASDGRDLMIVGQDYAHRYRFGTGQWEFVGVPGIPRTVTGTHGQLLLSSTQGVSAWTGSTFALIAESPAPYVKNADDWPDYLRAVTDPDGVVFAATGPLLYASPATPGTGPWSVWDVPGPVDNVVIGLALDRERLYATSFAGASRWDGRAWRRWNAGPCGAGCDTTFTNPTFAVGVFADSRRVKWVGSWSIALDRFTDDTSPPVFQHLTEPMVGDTATRRTWTFSGAEDAAGRVWLGMDTPASDDPNLQPIGITVYEPDGTWLGAWSSVNSPMAGDFVWALERDRYGRMWIGYKSRGVDYIVPNPAGSAAPFDPATFAHLTPSGNLTVRGIGTFGDTLWVLTETGLQRYRMAAPPGAATLQSTIVFPVPAQPTLAQHPFAVAPDGSVWAATVEGVWHVTAQGNTQYTAANSPLASNTVRSVVVEPSGAVWIGTVAGLQRFDPGYVPPPSPPQPSFTIRAYPNPATRTSLGVRLRLTGAPAGTRGLVYDPSGRRVRRFTITNPDDVFWDGRDDDGRLVHPGVYFVHAAAGGQEAFARVVILR